MNKKNLLFLWTLCPIVLFAQFNKEHVRMNEWSKENAFNDRNELVVGIENVLDSIVSTRYENGAEYLFSKLGYEYDDFGRKIEFFNYSWDIIYDEVFQLTQRDYTYFSDKIIEETKRATNAIAPLMLDRRTIRWLDQNGVEEEIDFENWDIALEEWVPNSRYVYIENSDTLTISYRYDWMDQLNEYQLDGKSESRTYDLNRSIVNFNIDADLVFVPNYKLEWMYNSISKGIELYEYWRFSSITDDWRIESRDRTVFDFQNNAGYVTKASNWNSLSNGDFIVYDSTTFIMDGNYEKISGSGYIPYSNNLDNFYHLFNYEYDYYPNGFIKEIRTEIKDVIIFEPYEREHYYRSDIEVVSNVIEPNIAQSINILAPNPARISDQLTISQLPEGQEKAALWVTDISGRILHRRSTRLGETHSIEDLGMQTGVQFVTLFVDGGQRTWKLLVN